MRNHSTISFWGLWEQIKLEDTNADLIRQEVSKSERLKILREGSII
mgnify:FL=1